MNSRAACGTFYVRKPSTVEGFGRWMLPSTVFPNARLVFAWPFAALRWISHVQMSFERRLLKSKYRTLQCLGFSARVKSIGFSVFLPHKRSPLSAHRLQPPPPPSWLEAKQAGSVPWEGISAADNGSFHSFWLPFICSHQHQSLSVTLHWEAEL